MGKYLDGSGVSHLWTLITQTFAKKSELPEGISPYDSNPEMNGIASAGNSNLFARGNHVHPTDTSRQAAITSSSKLSADLISDGTTNKAYTATEKTKLSNIPSNAEENVVKSVNTTAGTSGINLSLTSGTLDVTIASGSVANNNSNFVTGGAVYTAINDAIATAQVGAAVFQGVAPTTFAPTNYKKGWYWIVNAAGTYAGHTCEIGDMIFCINNYSSAYSASDFSVVQNDIDRLGDDEIDTAIANANS